MAMKSGRQAGDDTASRQKKANSQIDLQSGSWSTVREEYNQKYPWFGSQIHFAIDVIRQTIRDIRRR